MALVYGVDWNGDLHLHGTDDAPASDAVSYKVTYYSDTGKPFAVVFKPKPRGIGFLKKH